MRRIYFWVGVVFGFVSTSCHHTTMSLNDRYVHSADSVMALMNLDEKIGQLSLYTSGWDTTGPVMSKDYKRLIREGKVGGIFNAFTVDYNRSLQQIAVEQSRLKIPLLFGYDVVHGHRTIFPIPLGQAASWDTLAIRKSDSIAAVEATAEGINWTYAPMVDLTRDPRWGRVMEGSGEDTWLDCKIAAARVHGFQSNGLGSPKALMACVKHFAAYGAPMAGRDYNTVDMSLRSLYEYYLPPYKAAIDAGAESVMTSFNEINGIPATSDTWLLTDVLRNQWHFNGFVVTDYAGIKELIPHGVAGNLKQAAMLAINAGTDMDMQSDAYQENLADLIKSGDVKMQTLDNAVRRILVAKFRLGLFHDPYKYCNASREKTDLMQPGFLAFARKFVSESCVLLKNNNHTLPIPSTVTSVALIGPLGNSKDDMLGSWSAAGIADSCVTLWQGLRNDLPGRVKLSYAKGCDVDSRDRSGFAEALALARKSSYVILALGESREMSGEAASRSRINIPGVQLELAKAILQLGKPTAVVLFNGRPLCIPELDSIAPSILESWFGGTESGNGIADVLCGKYNPSGKLTMTFPVDVGQIPIFYNCKNTGRPVDPANPNYKYASRYIDVSNEPLYPFGYGLSYTTFGYSKIRMKKHVFRRNEPLVASVDITNTGAMDGTETAQLYVHEEVGNVTRPVKELKGYRRVFVPRGKTVHVTFTLWPKDLSYYHQHMKYGFDNGAYKLYIGKNSADCSAAEFTIKN